MSAPSTALVTGCSGQDGSLMAELLKPKGYFVVGSTRPGSGKAGSDAVSIDAWVEWDGLDQASTDRIIDEVRPDEVYNFAAFTSGEGMWTDPVGIGEVNGLAVVRLLDAIRRICPEARMVQASSSEVFGRPARSPQDEFARRDPRSPYGAAKLYADNIVTLSRDRYGLFACSAILFNHESVRRGPGFVSREISRGAAAISLGLADRLLLGDLEARRDWGFAGDHVRAMWLMLQADAPQDYVIATGISHSVRDLCLFAFEHVGLDYTEYVGMNPAAYRPPEPVPLVGDIGKARSLLKWAPEVDLKTLMHEMVEHDLLLLRQQAATDDGASNDPR